MSEWGSSARQLSEPASQEPRTAEPPANAEPPPALPETTQLEVPRRAPAAGDEVVVILSGGERLEGLLLSQDERTVVLRISGVAANIDRSTVERIIPLDPPAERYRRMRALIGDADTERLVMLADWLQRRRMYAEALIELDRVLKTDPNDGDALRLKGLVTQLQALERRARPSAAPGEPEARPAAPSAPVARRPTLSEFPLLRADQINLMKVYEIDLKDPPKIAIQRQAVDRLLNQFADNPLIPATREGREAFHLKSATEILDVMFRVRARELYDQVQVLDQPRSMKLFRDQIHSAWLINSCATTRCHGGTEAGRLQLTNRRPTAEPSVYTNFLIIDRFVTKDGRKLIDFEEPERSILFQMALPRDDVPHPHPAVQGWAPVFRSRDNRRYLQALDWARTMYRPRPDYPIEYTPPGEASSSPPGPDRGPDGGSGPVPR